MGIKASQTLVVRAGELVQGITASYFARPQTEDNTVISVYAQPLDGLSKYIQR